MKGYDKHGVFFCLFAVSCADAQSDNQPDAGVDTDTSDAEVVPLEPECPDYLPDQCGENCVSLADDPTNCGMCEHSCGGLFSDYDCYEYECRCGLNARECTAPAVCFSGMCAAADPTGEPCDPIESDQCSDQTLDCLYHPTLKQGFCTYIECSDEVCNGRDDDCDGDSDEVEDTTESCYNGPAGTEGVGTCDGGYRMCIWNEFEQGMTECVDEVLPVPETGLFRCDKVDNDCDGCADGRWEDGDCVVAEPPRFQVVFFIDTSASMSGVISVVGTATGGFATTNATNPLIEWGLVVFPGASGDATVEVRQDLTDYTTFMSALTGLAAGSGGSEGNWDAIYMAATDALPLSFTPDAQRVYIMFTDEAGQSYYPTFTPGTPGIIDEATMCASLTDEVLAIFSTPSFSLDFDDCGIPGSPFTLDSFTTAEDLVGNIELTFDSACVE